MSETIYPPLQTLKIPCPMCKEVFEASIASAIDINLEHYGITTKMLPGQVEKTASAMREALACFGSWEE